MCVIYYCRTAVPSERELRIGAEQNPHGGGIGWYNPKKAMMPTWKKNLSVDEVLQTIAEHDIKPPFFIHFRIASVGGVEPGLCHPFPISKDAGVALEGESPNGLLFHNGTWSAWKHELKEAVVKSGGRIQIPDRKPWSDSRSMAFLANHLGANVLPFISGIDSQRIGIMTRKETFVLGDWHGDADQGWSQSSPTYESRRPVTTPGLTKSREEETQTRSSVESRPRSGIVRSPRAGEASTALQVIGGRRRTVDIDCYDEADMQLAMDTLKKTKEFRIVSARRA